MSCAGSEKRSKLSFWFRVYFRLFRLIGIQQFIWNLRGKKKTLSLFSYIQVSWVIIIFCLRFLVLPQLHRIHIQYFICACIIIYVVHLSFSRMNTTGVYLDAKVNSVRIVLSVSSFEKIHFISKKWRKWNCSWFLSLSYSGLLFLVLLFHYWTKYTGWIFALSKSLFHSFGSCALA